MRNIGPLGIKAKECRTLISKVLGFMFAFSKKNAKLFIFNQEKNVDIHMFFVFFPLIVVWLDKRKRIVKMKRMIPFVSYSGAKAKYVLEIPYSEKIFRKLKRMKKLKF